MKPLLPAWIRIRRLRRFAFPIYVHWSVLVVVALLALTSIKSPIHAAVAIVSYLSVIAIHELGHAFAATKLGYEVVALRIGFFHGCCEYEATDTELEDVWIAWGGVLAQLAVAIPVLAIAAVTEDLDLGYAAPIIVFLGYMNLLCALVNLAPTQGMDGQTAWRALPLLASWLRARKATKDVVTSLKRKRW